MIKDSIDKINKFQWLNLDINICRVFGSKL